MTAFQIKLIAISTMIIDHIGLFFFPNLIFLRIIGRISFPLFAWLIANGAHYTRDIKAYMSRILIFAIVSQIPFFLANHQRNSSFWELNVLFTLCIGLVAIMFIKKTANKLLWFIIVIFFAIVAIFLKVDYGAIGIFSIVSFYIFYKNKVNMILSQILIYTIPYISIFIISLYGNALSTIRLADFIEPMGLLSLIFIYFYNNKEGPKAKYLFYVFYPLQYVFIYLIK